MVLKRFGALALSAVLALGLLPAGALAARNEKMDADTMDIPAIIEAKDADGTVNVYHWWTAGWFGMCIDGFVVSNDSADVEAGLRWAYSMSTPEVQTAFSTLKESISPYTDTSDETYNELTLQFKNELTAEGTNVFPSFTHGTALPWSASTSLQTQIQEFATSAEHDAEYFANRIVNILKEADVKGDWNLVD